MKYKDDSDAMTLNWELDGSREAAVVIGGKITKVHKKYAALSLLKSVTGISAEFEGNLAIYRVRLTICVESPERACVVSIFRNEEIESSGPVYCVRTGGFSSIDRKIMEGRIRFIKEHLEPTIDQILSDVQQIALTGLFAPIKGRSYPSQWIHVSAMLENGSLNLACNYATAEYENIALESICERCFRLDAQLGELQGVIPDRGYGCKLSFDPLLFSHRYVDDLNDDL